MDFATKQREAFFNNLLILGLDKTSYEKKYRMVFDKDMFCKPNQKIFEIVTHFLFSKLNEVSSHQFELPWPIMDKSQHRQFQKSVFTHLTAIAAGSDVKFPRFVSSWLSTFSGDRFYELYLAFSSHVMQKTILKKSDDHLIMMPTVTPQNSQAVTELLMIATSLSVEKFQEVQSFSLNHFKMITNCAKNLCALVESLKENITTNTALLEKSMKQLQAIYFDEETQPVSIDDIVRKAFKYEQKVITLWSVLEEFLTRENKLWSHISSQVEENQDTFCLDGSKLQTVTTDDIKKLYPESKEVDQSFSENEEKPCLLNYLKSFHFLLQFYLKSTFERELLETSQLCHNKDVANLENSFNHLKTLNLKLINDVLPSMIESTQNLEESLHLKHFSEDLEEFVKLCPSMICCSTYFQNQLNKSRTEMISNMCHTGGTYDSSVLSDYTKHLEGESLKSRNNIIYNRSNAVSSRDTDQESIFKSIDCFRNSELYLPITHQDDKTVYFGNERAVPENVRIPFEWNFDPSTKACGQSMDPEAASTQVVEDHSILSNWDENEIEYKKPYKMRESWQLEESLNAMTLPDMPEFEHIE